MRSYIECYPCFLKQAVEASKIATEDENVKWQILQETLKNIMQFSRNETPAIMGKKIHALVRRLAKNPDPYLEIKKNSNKAAEELIPLINKNIEASKDEMLTALKMLAIVNIIDFGPLGMNQVNLREFLDLKLKDEFVGNLNPNEFIRAIENSKSILYVADNCGEIVIDAYFIEKFFKDKKVYLSLRGSEVLNDATKKDIEGIPLSHNVEIIDNKDNAPGLILKNSSADFKKVYKNVDLVILKGQGNYEGIGTLDRDQVVSILVAKCPVIARHIGCSINDIVITVPGES